MRKRLKTLSNYRNIQENIQEMQERAKRLRSAAEKLATRYSATNGSGGKGEWTDLIDSAEEIETKILEEIVHSEALIEEIMSYVVELNPREAEVIRKRYLAKEIKSWRRISQEMHLTESGLYYIHQNAIKKLIKMGMK